MEVNVICWVMKDFVKEVFMTLRHNVQFMFV